MSPHQTPSPLWSKIGQPEESPRRDEANVLPPSIEIQLIKDYRNSVRIGEVVSQLRAFPQIEEIQYGQEWVETFSVLVHLLRLTQWILGGL